MSMTVLVTGAGGFLGQHLCPLLADNWDVLGVDLPGVESIPTVRWSEVDSPGELAQLVRLNHPTLVIHLAFMNRKTPGSTDGQYLEDILSVNLPFFEAMAKTRSRLLLISSSAVYGNTGRKAVIDETYPLQPVSLYGLAKAYQELAAQYFSGYGLEVCTVRLFNLCGPGQKRGMLLPDWIAQARAVVRGEAAEFKIKHRRTSRDFVDVRDAAKAVALIALEFKPGEIFNVASGQAVSLMSVSEELQKLCPSPLKIVETEIHSDEEDVLIQCGSFDKINTAYGWHPSINWRQSLKDMWDSHES
jgi:nucleoside-diphosphate-sugar epimerase